MFVHVCNKWRIKTFIVIDLYQKTTIFHIITSVLHHLLSNENMVKHWSLEGSQTVQDDVELRNSRMTMKNKSAMMDLYCFPKIDWPMIYSLLNDFMIVHPRTLIILLHHTYVILNIRQWHHNNITIEKQMKAEKRFCSYTSVLSKP